MAGVSSVYLHVMEDVINSVRTEFQSENMDERILLELQSLWELKMIQSGALLPSEIPPHMGARAIPPTPVQDLNIPYEATEEFTPTREMLFSPYSTPTPGTEQGTPDPTAARPSAGYGDAQQQSWLNHKRRGVDVNVAYEEGQDEEDHTTAGQAPVTKDFFTTSSAKRKRDDLPPSSNFFPGSYIPQQDGVCDDQVNLIDTGIPQVDGTGDNYDDDVAQEDYNEAGEEETPAAAKTTRSEVVQRQAAEAAESEDSEPPLNEEDDEDVDGLDQGDEEPKTNNLVLAQFEKVTRSKNKWKCILKDGIMHLNNRDILFLKANGEFEF